MWLTQLFCAVDRHTPDRNRVRWDGFAYVGQCTRCGAPIRRLRQKRWTANFRGHANPAPSFTPQEPVAEPRETAEA